MSRSWTSALVALILLILLLISCGPATTTKYQPDAIYDVGWEQLLKDRGTAEAYVNRKDATGRNANFKVRIAVDPAEYSDDGGEVHVWASPDRNSPPGIIIKCPNPYPKKKIIVTGRITSVVRDGRWRSARCDFYVVMEECVIQVR